MSRQGGNATVKSSSPSINVAAAQGSDASDKPKANAATGVSAASARTLGSRLIAFYSRAPAKAFFRKRVDYLAFAKAVNPRVQANEAWSWRISSPALLEHAVRTYGWEFIPKNVLPPLLANVSAGAVLYTTYLQALGALHHPSTSAARRSSSLPPVWSTLAAGGVAGAVHSTIMVPMEALQANFRATNITDHKYKSMWHYAFSKSRELGFRLLYAGWGLGFVKDAVGCGLFFMTFEYIKSQCYHHFIDHFYGQTLMSAMESSKSEPDTFKPHYALEPTFLMLAGIAATIVQQIIQHPLEIVQTQFYHGGLVTTQNFGMQLKDGRIARSLSHAAYLRTYEQLGRRSRESPQGWKFLYKGFVWGTMRQVPSTSAGLVIFELVRRRYDINAEL